MTRRPAAPTSRRTRVPVATGRVPRPARRWLAAWLGIAVLAVANGAFRERVLAPRCSRTRAHQLSTGLLVGAVWAVAARLDHTTPLPDRGTAVRVGAVWAASTVLFESGLGLARGLPPAQLVADYDVRAGRMWALVPLTMAVAPTVTRMAHGSRVR
jgi:hypothetical protein